VKNIIFAVTGAIAYGWMEQHLFAQGASSGGTRIFGFFGWPYHFPAMFLLMFAVSWPRWELLPVVLLVQDLSYVAFGVGRIEEGSWITEILGHFTLEGNIVPYAYIVLILLTITLVYLKRRHKWTF